MDFSWISDLKDLFFEAITYLESVNPWLGVSAVVILILAVAARIADLDEIIRAWKAKGNDDEEE